MPLPMSVESESKETTVASSEALTRWYNLSEEVLVLHQTLKISAFIFLLSLLGKPSCKKSAVFLNIVQKALDPPPFYLNICPILQGVFFKTRF